jgi:hypothetical protein
MLINKRKALLVTWLKDRLLHKCIAVPSIVHILVTASYRSVFYGCTGAFKNSVYPKICSESVFKFTTVPALALDSGLKQVNHKHKGFSSVKVANGVSGYKKYCSERLTTQKLKLGI